MTAGGIVCAQSRGLKLTAVDVGYSRLAAASVARKAIYDRAPSPPDRLVIAFGESLALLMATGLPIPAVPDNDTTMGEAYTAAAGALVAFGKDRFIGLVEALEQMRRFGVYKIAIG